jgi:hypothetical protein
MALTNCKIIRTLEEYSLSKSLSRAQVHLDCGRDGFSLIPQFFRLAACVSMKGARMCAVVMFVCIDYLLPVTKIPHLNTQHPPTGAQLRITIFWMTLDFIIALLFQVSYLRERRELCATIIGKLSQENYDEVKRHPKYATFIRQR